MAANPRIATTLGRDAGPFPDLPRWLVIARTIAQLLGGPAKPLLGLGEVRELALMTAQSRDLAIECAADVDQLVGFVGAPQEELSYLPGLQSRIDVLPKVERVARRRKDGVNRDHPYRTVVRMVHPFVVDEQHGGIVPHDDLRLEATDGVGDPLTQPQGGLDLPVGLVQEIDSRDAELRGGGALLLLAPLAELTGVDGWVVASFVAAGDEEIANLCAAVHPACDRARRPELDVVGVRGYDQHPFGGWQPVDRHRSGDPGRKEMGMPQGLERLWAGPS